MYTIPSPHLALACCVTCPSLQQFHLQGLSSILEHWLDKWSRFAASSCLRLIDLHVWEQIVSSVDIHKRMHLRTRRRVRSIKLEAAASFVAPSERACCLTCLACDPQPSASWILLLPRSCRAAAGSPQCAGGVHTCDREWSR